MSAINSVLSDSDLFPKKHGGLYVYKDKDGGVMMCGEDFHLEINRAISRAIEEGNIDFK